MGYEYADSVEPFQAPELGTPRPGPGPKRKHGFVASLERGKEDSKIVFASADVVTLLLMEGTSKAMGNTWRKLKIGMRSIGEQYPQVGRAELWGKRRRRTSLGTKRPRERWSR
jgi:hypothetical protein